MTVEGGFFCSRCGAGIGPGAYFCPRCGTSIPVVPGEAPASVATAPGRPGDAEREALLGTLRQATLGEYELLTELGHGGMATVYLARDLALDRKVAIKVLAPALLAMGEGMVERFKREARTAAALSHPHIIPVYAVKESERVLYFVMKYVEGRPLDSIIRDVGRLPIPMVQTILAQVGDALGYAHRHGVIHRDVKSANIMLDEDGWAVVTDFGIAKVVQAEGLTLTGVTVGTPTYMSPEQCDTREVTGASDQYSLGVVAYEMLTGALPFHGDSTMSVMYAHFNQRPRAVTELRPDCPPNLAAAVMRMLEKDPTGRWPSMDDVVAVCGRPSLRHDDPVRGEMITLARAGRRRPLLSQFKTPTSPIAPSKSRPRPATTPRARRVAGLWWGVAAAAGAAALWWAAPWREVPAPTPPSVTARDTLPAAEVMQVSPSTTVVRPQPPPAATAAPAKRPLARVTVPPAVTPESASRAAAAQREDSLVRSVRATAVAAMRRALEAGATQTQMARGDTVFKSAESLAGAGRSAEALVQLATAASLWAEAEGAARTRAVPDTARQRPAEPPAKPPVPHPPVNARAQIELVIAAYGRALESRDVSELRRVYPGLGPADAKAWRDLFQSVRDLKADLTVNKLVLGGDTADAMVSGVVEYVQTRTGRRERVPTPFRAIFVQDSTGWRLTSIHTLH